MAIILKTDNSMERVEPKNGKDFKLPELQKIVDGYIEIVHLSETEILVINEEGKIKNLPMNFPASYLAGEIIVGNVLLCKSKQVR